jgi:hypothetical protein
MSGRALGAGVVVVLIALCGACATRQPIRGQEVSGLDQKLSTFAFIEEGDLVTLIVDTHAARDKDGRPYVPLEIAVANHGLRKLAMTLESFTLLDSQGNRYPAAHPRELLQGYDMLDFDRNLAELEGITFNRFGAMARYPSNFSPTRTLTVGGSSLVRDLVALPRHGYIIDFIYFPAPLTGIRDQQFELFLDSSDLDDPVFVKFEVR